MVAQIKDHVFLKELTTAIVASMLPLVYLIESKAVNPFSSALIQSKFSSAQAVSFVSFFLNALLLMVWLGWCQ
jgi:hypothetical protein